MHVMLDLETLGTTPGHVVTQIAALEFDPHRPLEFGRSIQIWLDVEDALESGMKVSADTLEWWMGQDEAARRRLFGKREERQLAYVAAGMMKDFWGEMLLGADTPVWAHGAAFDFPMLEAAFRPYGVAVPWHYRAVRDTRTLYDLVRGPPQSLVRGVPHDALDDCRAQATQVQQAFLQLRNLLPDLGGAGVVQGGPLALFAEAVGGRVQSGD